MRRIIVVLALVSVIGVAGVIMGRSAIGIGAQADTTAGHPLVGTWIVLDERDTTAAPSMTILTSIGIVFDASAAGRVGAGSWEATGPRSGAATFVYVFEGQTGDLSATAVIRAAIEVNDAGDTFTADYSYTSVAPDGTVVDSLTSTARGVRVSVEPVENAGTPLARFPTVAVPATGTPAP